MAPTELENELSDMRKALIPSEQAFCDNYLITHSKSKAARAAGFSPATANQSGWGCYNRPRVKKYIEAMVKATSVNADETIKLISEIATSSITDYFELQMIEVTPKIKVPLAEVIAEHEMNILIEEDSFRSDFFDRNATAQYWANVEHLRLQITRMRSELRYKPGATRIMNGEPELKEDYVLNMTKLVEDRERGKVKRIKHKPDGTVEVEMYSAADAQEKIARMHGLFEKDNKQKVPVDPIDYDKLSDSALEEIVAARRPDPDGN